MAICASAVLWTRQWLSVLQRSSGLDSGYLCFSDRWTRQWLSVLQWSSGLDSGYLCFVVVSVFQYQWMALLIYFLLHLRHGCFTMAFIMALLGAWTRHWLSVLLGCKFWVWFSIKEWLCLYFSTLFKDMVVLQWHLLWHCSVSGLDTGYLCFLVNGKFLVCVSGAK